MTPIENILQEDCGDWTQDYLQAMRKLREQRGSTTLVDHHKAKLGKQSRTFNGEFRYWIWETGTWTVFISNFKGVGFEVPEASTKKTALDAWADYKERMGL